MIRKYAAELATQMGKSLSRVSVIDGRTVGCLDVFLLHLTADDERVSVLVHQADLDELQSCSACERLESRIRIALSRL